MSTVTATLDDVVCQGVEADILQCSNSIGVHTCDPAGVICGGKNMIIVSVEQ